MTPLALAGNSPTAGSSRRRRRLAAGLVAVLVLMAGAGCGLRSVLGYVAVWHPVWLTDGWIYHLRELDTEGVEIWRHHHDGRDEVVATRAPGSCARGVFRFLFRASGDRLGVAVECSESGWKLGEGSPRPVTTQLFVYHPVGGTFTALTTVAADVSDATFRSDRTTGFLELPTYCGTGIGVLHEARVRTLQPTGTDGRAWRLTAEPAGEDCGESVYSSSPALTWDGRRMYFLAAPGTAGRLPLPTAEFDRMQTDLYVWQGHPSSFAVRRVASLRGRGTLAMSPDGTTVAVASAGSARGVTMIDTDTGRASRPAEEADAYHPAFAPSGERLAYVRELSELVIVDAA